MKRIKKWIYFTKTATLKDFSIWSIASIRLWHLLVKLNSTTVSILNSQIHGENFEILSTFSLQLGNSKVQRNFYDSRKVE